jgi:N-dimethylarginine dimethylaminohydrolase
VEIKHRSEVGRISRLLLKRPDEAFISQENLDRHWRKYGFSGCPDFRAAKAEYEALLTLLRASVPHIHFLPASPLAGLDSIYVRDALIITDAGAVLPNMGKAQRQAEPAAMGRFLALAGIPLLGEIRDPGRIEGGDVVFLDAETVAVGRGYRTNAEGIRQLTSLIEGCVSEVIVVPLPHWRGPGDVLHLMSLISPLDHDLALVYSPLLPVPFREWLLERGLTLLEVPPEEYDTMAANVLAVGPRDGIMLSGNPQTRNLLSEAGVRVREYRGDHISRRGAGGPTCLTRPLSRFD